MQYNGTHPHKIRLQKNLEMSKEQKILRTLEEIADDFHALA